MDWMVEQKGFELSTPRAVVFGKLHATLARYLAERKASSTAENLIAGNSPLVSEPLRVQLLF